MEVWETYIAGTQEVHHSFFKTWFDDELHELRDLLNQLRVQHRTFETDAFFDHLKRLIREFISVKDGSFSQRFSLYQLFWTNLFTTSRLREEELVALPNPDERLTAFFLILL